MTTVFIVWTVISLLLLMATQRIWKHDIDGMRWICVAISILWPIMLVGILIWFISDEVKYLFSQVRK